nr:isoprenylcysteine carboxylmethyltransferase family protein [Desulfobulbaceae bacterium]
MSEKSVQNKILSYSFVAIQFICVVIIIATGPVIADGIYLFGQCAAIILGLWALLVMRHGLIRMVPDVGGNAVLIRQGPYRRVRHPMYTALILLMAALVFNEGSLLRFVTLAVLCLDLLGKLLYEEKLLRVSFDGYGAYCRTTWRLIPFIY